MDKKSTARKLLGIRTGEEIMKNDVANHVKDLEHLLSKVDSETLVELKFTINNHLNFEIEKRISKAEHELDVLSIHACKQENKL